MLHIKDQILTQTNGSVDIHPSFQPWHKAITSGYFLEIQRLEYPEGQLARALPLARAYFWGPPGERCLAWPSEAGSGEILLSQPTLEELQSFVGYLVGWVEVE